MFGIDPGYIAVFCGLVLTWCGYNLGHSSGVRSGIEFTLEHLAQKKYIRVVTVDGEQHIMSGAATEKE